MHKKLVWTDHSKIKMRQYGLSKQKLMGILYKPERREKGIAAGTAAVMRTNKIFFNSKKITVQGAWSKPKKADIKYTTLMKVESGAVNKPSVQTMAKIAKALGVSIEDLIK